MPQPVLKASVYITNLGFHCLRHWQSNEGKFYILQRGLSFTKLSSPAGVMLLFIDLEGTAKTSGAVEDRRPQRF